MLQFETLEKYNSKGVFTFQTGDKLAFHCKYVPNEPGIYLIYTIKNQTEELVYIGASGKVKQDGSFGVQKLNRRLQNMQNSKLRRQDHFDNELNLNTFDSIKVKWYVTFDETFKHLPMYVEANLLQEFFEKHNQLPKWNKQA